MSILDGHSHEMSEWRSIVARTAACAAACRFCSLGAVVVGHCLMRASSVIELRIDEMQPREPEGTSGDPVATSSSNCQTHTSRPLSLSLSLSACQTA